jgi:hypothetical protein
MTEILDSPPPIPRNRPMSGTLLSPLDSGFFSETSSCGSTGISTPIKQRFGSLMTPPSAPKAYKYRKNPRHKVKRRLFDNPDCGQSEDGQAQAKKPKKCDAISETINFETEVETLIRICKKVKKKLPRGPDRSPGSPRDSVSFSNIKPYILLLQEKLEESLGRMMEQSCSSETIELCFVLWPVVVRIPTSWDDHRSNEFSLKPIKIIQSYLTYLITKHIEEYTAQQLIMFSERIKTLIKSELLDDLTTKINTKLAFIN